jgi:transcription elongation factor GreA
MTNYISKEGLADLKQELIDIREKELPRVLDSINKALAEGDLRENSALDSAKLERDNLVARENEVQDILLDYEVIEESTGKPSQIVKIGSKIRIKYLTDNSTFDLAIVGSSESDAITGKISNESPLATALLGKKEGDKGQFSVNGKSIEIELLEILG